MFVSAFNILAYFQTTRLAYCIYLFTLYINLVSSGTASMVINFDLKCDNNNLSFCGCNLKYSNLEKLMDGWMYCVLTQKRPGYLDHNLNEGKLLFAFLDCN